MRRADRVVALGHEHHIAVRDRQRLVDRTVVGIDALGFERLSRLMRDVFGLSISEGALVNILSTARESFAAASAAIRDRLLSGSVICSDETGLRVGKRSWWLWVFAPPAPSRRMPTAVFLWRGARLVVASPFRGLARPTISQ